MKVSVLILVCLGTCVSVCSGQDRIDLPQAIGMALKQNKTLAKSILQTEIAVLGIDEARAPFALTIHPDGSSVGMNSGQEEAGIGLTVCEEIYMGHRTEPFDQHRENHLLFGVSLSL